MTIKIDQIADSLVSVPGSLVRVTADQPASNILIGASYTQFFPDSSGYSNLIIPVAGRYRVTFSGVVWGNGSVGTAQIEMRIDEGVAAETTVGGDSDDSWRMRVHSSALSSFTVVGEVELAVGSHTLKVYGKTIVGAGPTVFGTATAPGVDMVADFTLVSGSGAGGAIDQWTSATDPLIPGHIDTDPITVADHTVTVSANERVQCCYSGWANSVVSKGRQNCYARLLVDDEIVQTINLSCDEDANKLRGNASFNFITEKLSTGEHSVKLNIGGQAADRVVFSGSIFSTSLYRGGLVPIEKDGVQVIDTPRALNFTGDNVQVTQTGGRANIAVIENADGVVLTESTLASGVVITQDIVSGVAPIPTNPLTVTFSAVAGETVLLHYIASVFANQGGATTPYFKILVDGSPINQPQQRAYVGSMESNYISESAYFVPDTSGDYTAELHAARLGSNFYLSGGAYTTLKTIQYRGGYTQADNIPILQYNTASAIDIVPAPGCSNELIALLNDGVKRLYLGNLVVDLTVSGRGGLDTGSEAVSTWYFIYLVPNVVGTGLAAVASESDPDTGPSGFDAWRYIGPIYNSDSGDILDFMQINSADFLLNLYRSAYVANSVAAFDYAALDLSAFVPPTANAVDILTRMESLSGSSGTYWVGSKTSAVFEIGVSGGNTETSAARVALSTTQTVYHKLAYSYGSTSNLRLRVRGWQDGYLAPKQAQAQAAYQPDTKSPQGTWVSSTTIAFDARPGQPSTSRLTLQDNKQRIMTTLTWDSANGVADLGYDEAGSQGTDKCLYFYCVPSSGNDNVLTVRASDNPPSVGPAGYSNWRCLWADYNDDADGLLPVYQVGHIFHFSTRMIELGSSTAQDSIPVRRDLVYCPLSAGAVILEAYVQTSSNGFLAIYVDSGSGAITPSLLYASQNVAWTFSIVRGSVPLPVPGSIYHRRHSAGTYGANSYLACCGWEDNWIEA